MGPNRDISGCRPMIFVLGFPVGVQKSSDRLQTPEARSCIVVYIDLVIDLHVEIDDIFGKLCLTVSI